MKKTIFLFLFFIILGGCSFNNEIAVYPKINSKNMRISDFLLSSDGSNIAILSKDDMFTYDLKTDILKKIETPNNNGLTSYSWISKNNKWGLVESNINSNFPISEEKLLFSQNILEGKLYDQSYNPLGTLELRLINWENRKILALVDRTNGKFNIVENMNGANSINVCTLSEDVASIRISYDTVNSYMLYFKNKGKLIETNNTDVKGFYNNLNEYFEKDYVPVSEKIYKRDINLGEFEIIDLSYKNNLILFIENNTKKLMVFNMKNKEIVSVNTPDILNAVSLNNNEIYVVAKSDKKFILQRINLKNGEYHTIFLSNEFIYKLWEYDNKVFFTGVITKDGENEYKFYRALDNGVENLFSIK